jgi:hypothetical protein
MLARSLEASIRIVYDAVCQPLATSAPENAVATCFFVKMEILRIVAAGKVADFFRVNGYWACLENATWFKVFKIERHHYQAKALPE